jgi:putative hydrolase
LDSDTHAPDDLIPYELAVRIARGAEIPESELDNLLKYNPQKILKKIGINL